MRLSGDADALDVANKVGWSQKDICMFSCIGRAKKKIIFSPKHMSLLSSSSSFSSSHPCHVTDWNYLSEEMRSKVFIRPNLSPPFEEFILERREANGVMFFSGGREVAL